MTVPHDANAVMSFTTPAKRETGFQKMIASIKWVVPQAKMKATKSQSTLGNGISLRRSVKNARTHGIATYAPKMAKSEQMCSHPSESLHTPHFHRGGKPCVSKRLIRKSS